MSDSDTTHARLQALERRTRRLDGLLAVLAAATILLAGALVARELQATGQDDLIRAREIEVVDGKGTVRARLGGDLPNAIYDGERVRRGATDSKIAGLMLYDRTGAERGGYVTYDDSHNVLLTLDAGRAGGHRQTAYFIADSAGATALRIWNGEGDHVEMRAGSGGARFNAVRGNRLVVQTPEIEDPASTEMCQELRTLTPKYELDRLLEACRQRMSDEGCRLCLGGG